MSEFNQDSKEEDLPRIEETLRELLALRIDESDGVALSISTLPAKIAVLMQVGLRRTIELAEAFIAQERWGVSAG